MERTPLTLSPEKVLEELTALLGEGDPARAVMAFDGDGTLWSGDVGEDLFHAALAESFLLETVRPALLAEAARYQLELGAEPGSANDVARALFASYLAGRYPERETCAMMTWCYAGHLASEVTALAERVVALEDVQGRRSSELAPIIAWARRLGVRCVLISASPGAIVEPAGELWGFGPEDIAAATPALDAGRVLPQLAAPVPYAEAKLSAGRGLFGDAHWLATFGDNVFDIEMLLEAEMGVAVRPKPKLRQQLAALGLRSLAAPETASVPRPAAR
ncbi:MAG TPA: HAD family hydrolase [Polyangiaceae bacterium]